jgi:DNA-binding NtrC family response regulator
LENSPTPILAFDEHRRLVFFNAAAERWVGEKCDSCLGTAFSFGPALSAPESASPALFKLSQLAPPPEVYQGNPVTLELPSRENLPLGAKTWAEFHPLAVTGEVHFAMVFLRFAEAMPSPTKDTLAWHAELLQYRQEQAAGRAHDRWAGNSLGMQRVRMQLALAASSASSTHIVGHPGAGGVELARDIHYQRTQGRAATVTLAADTLDEVRLSGVLTALTSEATTMPGTLIVVALETLSPDMQSQFAARLKDATFQVLTCSKKNLCALREAGFLPALLAKIAAIEIELPPLGARKEDLPLLAQALVEASNTAGEKQISGFTADALEKFLLYDWPGDAEQLAQIVAQSHAAAQGSQITVADLGPIFCQAAEAGPRTITEPEAIDLDALLREVETETIRRALSLARGNKTLAAKLLGLSRPRLYRRMVQLHLIDAPEGWPLSIDEEPPDDESHEPDTV